MEMRCWSVLVYLKHWNYAISSTRMVQVLGRNPDDALEGLERTCMQMFPDYEFIRVVTMCPAGSERWRRDR